jgi:hypothetical protein
MNRLIEQAAQRYAATAALDARRFEGAPVFYQNDWIVVLDVRRLLPSQRAPWEQRPLDAVEGLFLHHKGGWADHWSTNAYAARTARRPQKRIAYQGGTHHDPEIIDGRVVVHLFNGLTDITPASGSPGADSAHLRRFPHIARAVNAHTVAFVSTGHFASRGLFAPHLPGAPYRWAAYRDKLIWRPSSAQIIAAWGLIQMCREMLPRFELRKVFGHIDSGKVACPGDDLMAFVRGVREGRIRDIGDVAAFLEAEQIPAPGFPFPRDPKEARDGL